MYFPIYEYIQVKSQNVRQMETKHLSPYAHMNLFLILIQATIS